MNLKTTLKRIGFVLLALFSILVIIVLVRTFTFTSVQRQVEPAPPLPDLDLDAAAERLAASLRFPTVSVVDQGPRDPQTFLDLHAFLRQSFPRTHATLQVETIATHSLLYTWPGSDPTLPPLLLMGHLDVVPVEPGTEDAWKYPPYQGVIAEGFIWGRGAIDDKGTCLGLLEATEYLLAHNFQPRRTVYLAMGHDEEVGGRHGAQAIVETLKARGVELWMVIDEGMPVTQGIMPGVSAPVAFIGTAEKGYLTLELSVKGAGGHSSMPPEHTAVGILAKAITRLEDNPMPTTLDGAVSDMLDRVGPEIDSFVTRMASANRWLFAPIIESQFASQPTTNAVVRTTTAVTVVEGSIKENVLPSRARALVNFRIHPQDSIASVTEHVRTTVDDERIQIAVAPGNMAEPSPLSSVESDAYLTLETTIRQVFPDAVVSPGLFIAMTDSRHYMPIARDVYRFMPFRMNPEDRERIHGTNERLSIENYGEYIAFYVQLLRNVSDSG